jgi:uncharacterized alpha-E superfamily protein
MYRNEAERRLGQLRAELDYSQVQEIIAGGLHQFLDEFQDKLNAVGTAMTESFFSPRPIAGNGRAYTGSGI